MSSITALFFEQVKKNPDKTAIWCDGNTKSYSELDTFVRQYINYLVSRDVKKGDIIGIPMNNSIESVALMLAAAYIGAGLAPINPSLPKEAINKAFTTANVKHVIARKSFWKHFALNNSLDAYGCKLCLDDTLEGIDSFDIISTMPIDIPSIDDVSGDETWILTMTSGSTGNPKPIDITQNNKIKRINEHVKMYGVVKEDRVLAATPLYHSLAERLVIMPLLIGATSILLPRFTTKLWLDCVSEQKVTFTIAVSAQLGQIAQVLSSPYVPDIASFRAIVSSSALLEAHVRKELIEKLKCDFYEMYGTSEVSTATSINLKESVTKNKSVGRAISCADICIIDDNESRIPFDEVGEIAVKTDLIFNGYYMQPDMTKKSFTKEGYFKTGDLGRLDSDGYLYFCGRKKELIITGGINVYPNDIDSVIQKYEGIIECAAFSYPDDRLGEVVAVAVVKDKKSVITERDIRVYCSRNLADFQIPHHVFFVDELPKNAMGKLVRKDIFAMVSEVNDGRN